MTEHDPKRADDPIPVEDEGFSDEPVAIPEPPPAAYTPAAPPPPAAPTKLAPPDYSPGTPLEPSPAAPLEPPSMELPPPEPRAPVPEPPETLAPLADLNPPPRAAETMQAGQESAQAMEDRMRRLEDALATLVERQSQPKPEPKKKKKKEKAKGAFAGASSFFSTARKAFQAKDRAEKVMRSAAAVAEEERWVLIEAFAELRDIFSMYVDRRYQVGWACWTFPSLAFLAMFLFYFTLGAVPIFGVFLDKIADLCLAFMVYKILRRESIVYRQTIAAAESEEEEEAEEE